MNSQESAINTQELPMNSQESLESVVLTTQTLELSTNSSFFKSADSSLSVLEDVMNVEEYVTSPLEKTVGDFASSTPKPSKRKSDDGDSTPSLLNIAFTGDFDDTPHHYENAQRMPSLSNSLENLEQPQSSLTTAKKTCFVVKL